MQPVRTVIEATLAVKYGDRPQKATVLPFVEKVGKKGKKRRFHYWQPKRTDSFWEDIAIGQYYATEALQYMRGNPSVDLLTYIAQDMQSREKSGMLEIQFWRTIRELTIKGLAS